MTRPMESANTITSKKMRNYGNSWACLRAPIKNEKKCCNVINILCNKYQLGSYVIIKIIKIYFFTFKPKLTYHAAKCNCASNISFKKRFQNMGFSGIIQTTTLINMGYKQVSKSYKLNICNQNQAHIYLGVFINSTTTDGYVLSRKEKAVSCL